LVLELRAKGRRHQGMKELQNALRRLSTSSTLVKAFRDFLASSVFDISSLLIRMLSCN